MPQPNLGPPKRDMTHEELINYIAEVVKRINYLFGSLDGMNIRQIRFDLEGGAYIQIDNRGLIFFDGEKETVKVDIDGQATLTGVKIQSKKDGYPRIEFNSENDLLTAYFSATSFLRIYADFTGSGSPALVSHYNNIPVSLLSFIPVLGAIFQGYNNDIILNVDPGYLIRIPNWSSFYSNGAQRSLQQELNSINSMLSNLNARVTALENSPPIIP